jgi:large subunit ribosomal protein L5
MDSKNEKLALFSSLPSVTQVLPKLHQTLLVDYKRSFRSCYNKSKLLRDFIEKEWECKNLYEVPVITKIVLSRGLSVNKSKTVDSKSLDSNINDFRMISGQQPILRTARKSVAGFQIREGMAIGISVTLRGSKLLSFLTKLIHIVLPRIKDFQGLSLKGFDGAGNYNFGIMEQVVFPELVLDSGALPHSRGLNVSIVTTARTDQEATRALASIGFPFQQ